MHSTVKEVEGDLKCTFSVDELLHETQANTADNPLPTYFYYGTISGEPVPNKKFVTEGNWYTINQARCQELAFEHNEVLEKLINKFLNNL